MVKFTKDFFKDKEILFLGVSQRYKMYCDMAYNDLTKKNVNVIPVGDTDTGLSFNVFKDIESIPKMPKTAYTIMDTEDNKKILGKLKEKGVERILFHSKNIYDEELLKTCESSGFEVSVACPLMAYGGGFHRFHGFLKGIKKAY